MRTTTSRATRRPGGTRRTALATLSAAALAAGLLVAGAPAQAGQASAGSTAPRAHTADRIVHAGQAYGSMVRGLGVVGSGRTALSVMCTTDPDKVNSNNVAASEPALSDAVDLGAITTSVVAGRTDGRRSTTSTTEIATVDLLGGVLQLEGITATATVVKTATGYRTEATSNLLGLSLGGVPIPLDQLSENLPAEIALPGLGTIFFNQQDSRTSRDEGTSTVTALRIVLPALDAEVKLGLAKARLADRRPGAFNGGAWSTDVTALGLVESGRTGYQPIPCVGTNGKALRTNDTAGVTLQDAVDIGATESVTRTFRRANGDVVATARNEVAGIDLGGQLNIEAVVAKVVTVRKPGGRIISTPSFRVLGLTAGGETQELPIPGEKFEIPGLGFLQFGDLRKTRRGGTATAVTLVLLEGDNEVRVTLGNAAARILR